MPKKVNTIGGIVLVVLCIIAGIYGIVKRNNLMNTHEFGTGYINSYSTGGGSGNAGGVWIDFSYTVNGENYNNSSRYTMSELNIGVTGKKIIKKTFPIIYKSDNPSNSKLMILPKDFEKIGKTFPDSLKWILPYFKMNKG